MVFAPNSFALAHAEDCAVRHHRIIAEAVPDMPVFLFQASVNAGHMGFTPAVLAQLLPCRPSSASRRVAGKPIDTTRCGGR